MNSIRSFFTSFFLLFTFHFLLFISSAKAQFDPSKSIAYCAEQAAATLRNTPPGTTILPRNVDNGMDKWRYVNYRDWTSGFWPGILWYLFEETGNKEWQLQADKFSRLLTNVSQSPASGHDLGFQAFNSFGKGYLFTGNEEYKKILLRTADTLATLYNPNVGTILSWPRSVPNLEWPQHNTIIDNMMNLELLFWVSKNGGSRKLYDIAVRHAEITIKNHFRPDNTAYHVVVYDKQNGKKIKGVTHQGYADGSMWARGQAWAIYGFTMSYRESKKRDFLDMAQKAADVYLARLPADLIPYWDFNAPDIPNAPRDASAAAITASALLELSTMVKKKQGAYYRDKAEKILTELSSERYLSGNKNTSFLLHSTGHKPNGGEVDASIIYADYYYLEALIRLKHLQQGKKI